MRSALASVILSLVACGSEQPELAELRVSLLTQYVPGSDYDRVQLTVRRTDGSVVEDRGIAVPPGDGGTDAPRRIAELTLLPGTYDLVTRLTGPDLSTERRARFDLEPVGLDLTVLVKRCDAAETACDDGADQDCDGMIDCDDDDCLGEMCDLGPLTLAEPNRGRCCATGQCVDIYTDRRHCGACNAACAETRRCFHRPGSLGSACRCVLDSECAGLAHGGFCRETTLDGESGSVCQCRLGASGMADCRGTYGAFCHEGAFSFNFCVYPNR